MDVRETVNQYVKKMKAGVNCFGELYDATYIYIKYMARKYLRNRDFVDEVVCETFFTVWQTLDKIDVTRNAYGYMCKIAKNTALKINLREEPINGKTVKLEYLDEVASDDNTRDIAEKADLYAAVQTLPEPDRSFVEERYIYNKNLREIADAFGVTAGTVHNRLKKSLKVIQEILQIR